MNYRAIALATIIGISTPAIINLSISQPALAQRYNYPQGTFSDRDWNVTLYFSNNSYFYYGESRYNSNSNITLSGATSGGNNARQIYTWNNNGTKYEVTWRPSDPDYIRVRVIAGRKVILNRLMTRNYN